MAVALVALPVLAEGVAEKVEKAATEADAAEAAEEPKVEVVPLKGTVIRWNPAFGALHLDVAGTEFVVPVTESTQLVDFPAASDEGLGVEPGDKVETSLGDEGVRILQLLEPGADLDQENSSPTPAPTPTPSVTPTPEAKPVSSTTPEVTPEPTPESSPEAPPELSSAVDGGTTPVSQPVHDAIKEGSAD